MRSLVLAGVIAAAPAARADGIGVIASARHGDAIANALAEVARESGASRVVTDAVAAARTAAAEGAVPVAALARFRRVQAAIDDAWRAYAQVQLDSAAAQLTAARTDAEGLLALPGGALVYADASLKLGAVLAQLGRADQSRAAIALALALDPDRPITELEFSPDVIAAVAAARAAAPGTRAVELTSEPAGAALSVDGRDAGKTPVALALAPGEHVAIARAPGFRPRAAAFGAGDGGGHIALALDRDDVGAVLAGGAAPGQPDAAAQALVDAALEFADLDEVALAADVDRRGDPTLLVQRCAGAPARCTAIVEIGYADPSGLATAARSAWASLRTSPLVTPPSLFDDPRVTAPPLAITSHHCTVCRSPYFWGGLGAAVLAGAITAIVIATESRPAPVIDVGSGFTH